jgi:cAMP-dependent protein kinase regulator
MKRKKCKKPISLKTFSYSIQERIVTAFMFKALTQDELNIVIDAMQGVEFKAGETVICEGDAGSACFLVDSGELDCSKIIDGENKYLKTYSPGYAFGELALLYNAPRAATIKAKTDAHLYELDRYTFNHIVKDASQRKRDIYEDFLQSVPIL